MLSGENAVGIGEASGIFPVDMTSYDKNKMKKYADKIASHGYDNDIYSLFPAVKSAGERGHILLKRAQGSLIPQEALKQAFLSALPRETQAREWLPQTP